LFQVCFTSVILLLTRLLPVGDAMGYILFFAVLVATSKLSREPRGKPWIEDRDWIALGHALFPLLLALNLYLTAHKGFLLFKSDLATTRLDFYEDWGIFKRLNEFGVGVVGLTGLVLWSRGNKRLAFVYMTFTAYLILTLGSKAGLLTLLFLYGARARFSVRRASARVLLTAGGVLGLSSLGLFFAMYGPTFILQFAVRLLAYSDGPVYFFYSGLPGKLYYGPGYAFDTFLIDLRLHASEMYTPLGRVLDWNFLGFDNPLTGPNPQFPVEAHVMFGWLFLIWYGLLAWAFVYFRKHTSTAFSFFLVSSVMGALLIDSQYAASELFTALLGLGLLFIVGFLRRLLILATLHSRYAMQWMQGVNE
jgi:hypothetical protein